MGLDMYLTGERFFMRRDNVKFPRKSERLELGYWRKHPNLHGFIIQTFADGEDDCREIPLDVAAMQRIIDAILTEQLPHTDGFFFGASNGNEKLNDLRIFREAIHWANEPEPDVFRTVTYQASW